MRAVGIVYNNGSKATALVMHVEHLLTRSQLAAALCWDIRNRDRELPLPDRSRAEAVAIIRSVLTHDGEENLGYWGDHFSERQAREAQAWADALVERHFGAMFRAAEQ